MAGAAYVIEVIFGIAALVPQQRSAEIVEAHITWNYPTWLNIVFLGLAARLASSCPPIRSDRKSSGR